MTTYQYNVTVEGEEVNYQVAAPPVTQVLTNDAGARFAVAWPVINQGNVGSVVSFGNLSFDQGDLVEGLVAKVGSTPFNSGDTLLPGQSLDIVARFDAPEAAPGAQVAMNVSVDIDHTQE